MPRVPADPIPPQPGSRHPVVFVGVLITIALAILVGGATWLARPGGPAYYVELREAPDLRVGAPVRFRGMTVGLVDDVAFTDTSVRIRMQFTRDDVPLRQGASARVSPTGILGDQGLELLPSATPGAPLLPPGSTLAAAAPDSARLAEQERAKAALGAIARDLLERGRGRDSGTATTGAPARRDSTARP